MGRIGVTVRIEWHVSDARPARKGGARLGLSNDTIFQAVGHVVVAGGGVEVGELLAAMKVTAKSVTRTAE